MATKRKHVDFEESAAPTASPAPTGPVIHPSRMAGNAVLAKAAGPDGASATKAAKKNKTVAKQRYLRVKAKKHRKLKAAKKASAPKNKGSKVEPEDGSDTDGDIDGDGNAEAGPSSPRPPFDTEAVAERTVPEGDVPKMKKSKKDKGKGKVKDEQLSGSASKDEDEDEDMIVPGGANDEESAKEQRKVEKRAKREARHLKRAQEAAALEERERARPLPQLLSTQPADDSDSDNDNEGDGSLNGDLDSDMDSIDDSIARSLSESPPPLEAFPLPTSAPAPDPSILSRQGLPAGITDATFIPQDLKLAIDDLRVNRLGKVEPGLSEHMKARLAELDIAEFFAVQAYMLPKLLSLQLVPWPTDPRNDFLISAPTGSGKTLAYCIPIIEMLTSRLVTRLRALIVLPTRDLVVQVRETLETLAKGTNLKIGVVGGHHSFKYEQRQLIDDMDTKLLGGSSKVDILIATPGRLMDHLTSTPNFTLQHLRFLIIDEADRLLNQSFQNWLSKVLAHLRPPTTGLPEGFERKPWDSVAAAWAQAYGLVEPSPDPTKRIIKSSCQKLLFSATLTRDPAKVAALDLHNPKYYVVQSSALPQTAVSVGEQFSLPDGLDEKMIVVDPALKALILIYLIHHAEYQVKSALVFTKSVESATRLVQLLDAFEEVNRTGIVVKTYTSEMKPGERKRLLSEFAKGNIHLLVCSDLIARGMDLPSVAHVVSYDIPLDMRKYVHRVGRTARAGRSGTAWSLVENQETLHFKSMLKAAGHEKKVSKMKIKEQDLDDHKLSYEAATAKLRQLYSRKGEE